ncbi:hypothetical protein BBG19_1487 [Francisella sp. MA067296]|nr:hypothetical protein BBG19_1487 [Francisella sp. MA067296]
MLKEVSSFIDLKLDTENSISILYPFLIIIFAEKMQKWYLK